MFIEQENIKACFCADHPSLLQRLPSSIGPNFTSFPRVHWAANMWGHTPHTSQKHVYTLIITVSKGMFYDNNVSELVSCWSSIITPAEGT